MIPVSIMYDKYKQSYDFLEVFKNASFCALVFLLYMYNDCDLEKGKPALFS